jgi:hypothetical protein
MSKTGETVTQAGSSRLALRNKAVARVRVPAI